MYKSILYSLLLSIFTLCTAAQAFANNQPFHLFLPAILAASAESPFDDEEEIPDDTLVSTGNFMQDFKLAINGLEASRFSLSAVADRYNEMGYSASVCTQVSYYHLNGGPFDKVIINGTIYDVLVIEQTPVRWNFGPFSVTNRGQCI